MNTFLLLLLTHTATTGFGLVLFRRWFANRSFQHPKSVGQALGDPSFRLLLGLVILLPFFATQVINHLVFGLDYTRGTHTWTLSVHTGTAMWYYVSQLRSAARRNHS
jgi:hypothetical protein